MHSKEKIQDLLSVRQSFGLALRQLQSAIGSQALKFNDTENMVRKMINENKTERVMIFIDGSNLYHSLKNAFSIHDNELDFRKLIKFLIMKRILVGTYYYNAPLDRSYNAEIYRKQQKFFAELRKIPDFRVILCNMRRIVDADGKVKYTVKGDDINLATDMISSAYENQYDTAILVSGDGDFVPAIKKIQKLGKRVENAYFLVSRSSFLKQVCDSSLLLDNLIEECLKKKK